MPAGTYGDSIRRYKQYAEAMREPAKTPVAASAPAKRKIETKKKPVSEFKSAAELYKQYDESKKRK